MKLEALYCIVCIIMALKKMPKAQTINGNVVYVLIPKHLSKHWYLGNNEIACNVKSRCIV